MAEVSKQEIEHFLVNQYRLWSEDRIDEMMDLFRRIAPNGFTIQYVGSPEVEGEKAMADMIAQYAGKMRTELVKLLVNGNEAATVVDNIPTDSDQVIQSIETYKFEGGKMQVRYFH